MFYVYVLENEERELYIGSTNDLRRRLRHHNSGKGFATRNYKWELIFYEAYRNEKDAREQEQRIKQHGQAKAQLKKRIRRSRRHQS